jgi:polyisoprenoid-binding protein YceI
MSPILRRGVAVSCALVFLAAPHGLQAAQKTLRVDPASTHVTFSLDAGLHTVHGTAKLTEGTIVFDDAAGKASGRVVVDARSLESGNGSRDKTMHGDVLESAKYPEIVLVPETLQGKVPADGEADITLGGALEIHGGRHAVSLPAHLKVTGEGIQGTARLDVPYVEWGMKDPSFFVLRVGKTVQVTLEITGRLGG